MYSENKDRFFIPKTIRVGYQRRDDTYTGKLAYVIYIDHTGKVRKETSWKNWKNDKIESDDFQNIPTEGFVLNKHVGGCRSYWNFRQSYCRIYDPRGFEFEITIDNLLWILDWEDCMHGKGLTGKFVYGWMGDQLSLIPCRTDDYAISQETSDRMFNESGTKKSDFIPGASYKVKNSNHPYVFIGNLKVQNKLGKGYKTHMFFYDPTPDKYEEYYKNVLLRLDKSSVLCKVSDNAMDKKDVDELVHRFTLSAYSYDFWHTENIIDKFIEIPPTSVKMNDSVVYGIFEKYNKFGIISEDMKSVTLIKPYIYYTNIYKGYYHWDGGHQYCIPYEFIKLDNKCGVERINDIGRLNEYSNYYENVQFKDLYPDGNEDALDNLKNKNVVDAGPVYYITNDGYISNSLMEMIKIGALNYISDMANKDLSQIILPIKMN